MWWHVFLSLLNGVSFTRFVPSLPAVLAVGLRTDLVVRLPIVIGSLNESSGVPTGKRSALWTVAVATVKCQQSCFYNNGQVLKLIFLITTHDALPHAPTNNQQYSLFFPKLNWKQLSCYNILVANNLPHLSSKVISCLCTRDRSYLVPVRTPLLALTLPLLVGSPLEWCCSISQIAGRLLL